MVTQRPARAALTWFLLVAAALALVYLILVPILWWNRGVDEGGPIRFSAPALTTALVPGHSTALLERTCETQEPIARVDYSRLKVVGGRVDGRTLYGCFAVRVDGTVSAAAVLDQDLLLVKDVSLLKRSGAWRWIGAVKTRTEVVLGFLGVVAILGVYLLYYRRPRPGPGDMPGLQWWQGRGGDVALGLFPCIGWMLLWMLPGRSSARRLRLSFMYGFAYGPVVLLGVFAAVLDYPDALSAVVVGLLCLALAWGWLGGRALVRAEGWGVPDRPPAPQAAAASAWGVPSGAQPAGTGSAPGPGPSGSTGTIPAVAAPAATQHGSRFKVERPDQLPNFADVGGMRQLKELLSDTFGLILAFSQQAERYRINFNGILLHGPPGVGKTYLARATAGEFGLNFVRVITGDLISKWLGESAKNVAGAFQFAAANVPCVLFFDEFDSVASRRDDEPDSESRRVVNQLLSSLEEYRKVRELIVMAATNRLERLDAAAVRPGRFDKHVRVDLPDREARLAVLAAQLRDRPVAADLDLETVADRTGGVTPAVLAAVVEEAALAALRESTTTNQDVPITTTRLLAALLARGGADRPTPTEHGWDDLILEARTMDELRQLQRLIEDTELTRSFGIDPPTGLLLAGPPGTGKTTIARVLAAEARCSFYAVSAADLTSKWVGESEQRVQDLFARARDNAPSIVFLDELDAIARRRSGEQGVTDRQLTQLLTEIDGLSSRPGVFVVGATNRPDVLDEAITRGGRLSRTILVPLPGPAAREAILRAQTRRMPIEEVDLTAVARVTEGLSGGDLKAVCQQAAINALVRTGAGQAAGEAVAEARVRLEDFAAAVAAIGASKQPAGPYPSGGTQGP